MTGEAAPTYATRPGPAAAAGPHERRAPLGSAWTGQQAPGTPAAVQQVLRRTPPTTRLQDGSPRAEAAQRDHYGPGPVPQPPRFRAELPLVPHGGQTLPAIAEQAYDEEATTDHGAGTARGRPLVEPALLRRYEICARVGGTSRCVVYKAYERARRRFVALKLWQDCFRDRASAQRCYREVAYLHACRAILASGRLRRVYVGERVGCMRP